MDWSPCLIASVRLGDGGVTKRRPKVALTPFKNKKDIDGKYEQLDKGGPQANKEASAQYKEIIRQTRIRLGLDKGDQNDTINA